MQNETILEELKQATQGMSLPVMLALLAQVQERMAADARLKEAATHLDQAIEVIERARNVTRH